MSFRQYVVFALGLSESYCQVEGVLQGGGLDPLFYILAVYLIHLAMRQLGVGVPVCVAPSVETIASLGCVDDTVGFSGIDDRQQLQTIFALLLTVSANATTAPKCIFKCFRSSKVQCAVLAKRLSGTTRKSGPLADTST